MADLPPVPIDEGELEAYRIDARRRPTTGQLGGHIVRRLGDSLDFREYIHYQPGVDIRQVDWRASSRPNWRGAVRASDAWLVRRYDAEERLKIVISLDTRETMDYPADFSKRTVACWLSEALSFVALRSGDEVVFHRLFGQPGLWSARLRGPSAVSNRRRALESVWAQVEDGTDLNLEGLERELPPAAVWIIISDLYFNIERAVTLSERMAAARSGRRWIILVELDSWSYERALLTSRLWRIMGPGSEPKLIHIASENDSPILEAEARIKDHIAEVASSMRGPLFDHVRWRWQTPGDLDPVSFFRERFHEDATLRRLFRSVPWR